jgi:hypothetical protein
MKLKLTQPIKSFKDEPLKNPEGEIFTLGEALANIFANSRQGGKMKAYILGKKFYNDKEIELDAADLSLVKETVKQSSSYNHLIEGQIEEMLERVKEDTKEEKKEEKNEKKAN